MLTYEVQADADGRRVRQHTAAYGSMHADGCCGAAIVRLEDEEEKETRLDPGSRLLAC